MKTTISRQYFNETLFGKFMPTPNKEDLLLLVKSISSYNHFLIKEQIKYYQNIGYTITVPLTRKFFKYSFQIARIVPLYQRLISYDAFQIVKDDKGKEKRVPVSIFVDRINYTDTDLELMRSHIWNEYDKSKTIKLDIRWEKDILMGTLTMPDGTKYERK